MTISKTGVRNVFTTLGVMAAIVLGVYLVKSVAELLGLKIYLISLAILFVTVILGKAYSEGAKLDEAFNRQQFVPNRRPRRK